MKHKNKIIAVAGLILMANFMFAPFVLAQQAGSVICSVTVAPPGMDDPTSSEQACLDAGGVPGQEPGATTVNTLQITKAEFLAARNNENLCIMGPDSLRGKLQTITNKVFKANWGGPIPQGNLENKSLASVAASAGCHIVPFAAKEGLQGIKESRNVASTNLESKILA